MHNDFFRLLESEHRNITERMNKILQSSGSKISNMFTDLKKDLLPHMKAEESAFYPKLWAMELTKYVAHDAVDEHHAAEKTVDDLDKLSVTDTKWKEMFYVLNEQLANHIHTEETTVFDHARQHISETDIEKIMNDYKSAKKEAVSSLSH